MSELLTATATLVNISSISRDERAIADVVEGRLRESSVLEVVRIGDNIVARTHLGRSSRIVLGGHLDTVPPNANRDAVYEGDRLFGCGSADMKGGIAILLALSERLGRSAFDVTLVFYACEEISREYSGLRQIASEHPDLLDADVAILLEPTSARVEAGCQGVLRSLITLKGRRSHSARPWTGLNAIHRLSPVLEAIGRFEERMPTIDGCKYHETLQAVEVRGGIAGNVIPDEAAVTVSFRFAPDRSVSDAFDSMCALFDPVLDRSLGDHVTLVDAASGAMPTLTHDVLARLVSISGYEPVAKLGWTDVAFFYERGVPAANFGPGDPLVAHSANEFVTGADLERVYKSLCTVLFP